MGIGLQTRGNTTTAGVSAKAAHKGDFTGRELVGTGWQTCPVGVLPVLSDLRN